MTNFRKPFRPRSLTPYNLCPKLYVKRKASFPDRSKAIQNSEFLKILEISFCLTSIASWSINHLTLVDIIHSKLISDYCLNIKYLLFLSILKRKLQMTCQKSGAQTQDLCDLLDPLISGVRKVHCDCTFTLLFLIRNSKIFKPKWNLNLCKDL